MKRGDRQVQHAANLLTIGTGAIYAACKYLYVPGTADNPYSRVQHPWEPASHDTHLIVAPLLVYACGLIWSSHVSPQWRGRRSPVLGQGKKFTGLALLASFAPMVFSGYALQVAVEDGWRRLWIGVHLLTSIAWSLSYGVHLLARARRALSH